ncbi:MAG: hypothetical protein IKO07_06050 [Clostridia bacterium]|nr:hypothetical protein [Clostridia bacterium]
MIPTVRFPRLLKADYSEKTRVHPSKMPLTIQTFGTSTAQMTLGEDDADVKLHDWFELYTENGSVGLFRATNLAWTVRRSRVVTLRHARDTFADSVWTRPDGTKLDYSGTVPAFLAAIMTHQKRAYWQLGTCADTSTWKKSGIYFTRLSDLLDELEKKRKDFMFTYDFSTSPWTLNFVALSSADAVEFRLTRNVSGCKITYDDEPMCNKLYMTWSVEGTDGITKTIRTYENSVSQNRHGVIEKTVDVKETNEPSPDAWAATFLADHADPSVQISIDGENIYKLTGLWWDEATRGKKARVALPDYGVTVSERLLTVKYADVINDPRRITVELANNLETVSSSLAQIDRTASEGYSAAGAAADAAESESRRARSSEGSMQQGINSIVEKTGINSLGQTETLYTKIAQNATDITLEAGYRVADKTELLASINVNAQAITAEVTRATGAEGDLSSRLTITADAITQEVTDRTNADNTLSSTISQTATSIRAEVSNKVDKSSVTIAADGITVDTKTFTVSATTIIDKLVGQSVSVGSITTAGLTVLGSATLTGGLTANTLADGTGQIKSRTVKCGANPGGSVMSYTTADLDLDHSHDITFTESSGSIVATVSKAINGNGTGSFSIAATQAYIDGVAAARNGVTMTGSSWNPATGVCSIALSNGNSGTVAFPNVGLHVTSWASNHKCTAYVTSTDYTGISVSLTVDATSEYNAGITEVTNNMTINTGSWNSSGNRTVAAKYNGTTYASSTISLPTITVSHTSWNANYQCTARAYASGIGYVDTDTIDASSVYSAGSSAGYSSGYSAGYSEGYADGQSSSSYSSSDLHISKSGGNVLLYLGNNVISRTCSIGVTNVSQSGPNSYRITVRIDGDTDFYLTY